MSLTVQANRPAVTTTPTSGAQRLQGKVGDHTLLKLGSSGAEVEELQKALQAAGSYKGPINGQFDASTASAVQAHQTANGLKVDGLVGQQTWGSFLGEKHPPGTWLLKGGSGTPGPSAGRATGSSTVDRYDDQPTGPGQTVDAYVNGQRRRLNVVPIGNGQMLQADAARNYKAMISEARQSGVNLSTVSGFRTHAQQQALYQKYLNGTGNLAARPGYSNHQNGISVDIGGVNSYGTTAFKWLQQNAGKYGFENDVRGEYWHWTYQG